MTSSRPVTTLDKSDVLAGLFAVWDEIDALLTGLAEGHWQAPTPLPGWNVHDVTAHLIGTESMLQAPRPPRPMSMCPRSSTSATTSG